MRSGSAAFRAVRLCLTEVLIKCFEAMPPLETDVESNRRRSLKLKAMCGEAEPYRTEGGKAEFGVRRPVAALLCGGSTLRSSTRVNLRQAATGRSRPKR
jgi:hypothetical protein